MSPGTGEGIAINQPDPHVDALACDAALLPPVFVPPLITGWVIVALSRRNAG